MYKIPNQFRMPCMIPMPFYNMYPYGFQNNQQMFSPYPYQMWGNTYQYKRQPINLMDYGPEPFVVDIDDAAEQNNNFRLALWTGKNLQVTLMKINVRDDIGLEVHADGDQFISIVEGNALVKMGDTQDNLTYQRNVSDDEVIFIPQGKWHNIINIGNEQLKLYAIYAPPQHPKDTVEINKENRYYY